MERVERAQQPPVQTGQPLAVLAGLLADGTRASICPALLGTGMDERAVAA